MKDLEIVILESDSGVCSLEFRNASINVNVGGVD